SGGEGLPSPLGAISIPDQVQWPYMQQWNFSVEHELPKNVLLSVAYVGSKGTHLTRQYDLNQLDPIPAGQNPYIQNNLGAITTGDCNSIAFGPDGQPTEASIQGTLGAAPVTVTDTHVLQNLFVACGSNGSASSYYRRFQGYGTVTRIDNSANSIY